MTIELSAWDREHVGQLLRGDSWNGRMMQLIAKSDTEHREALRRAFPEFVEAYERWFAGPNDE